MAVAFKCDICGALYEGYDGIQYDGRGSHFKMIKLSNDSMSRAFDACPECMQATINFIRSRADITKTKKGES